MGYLIQIKPDFIYRSKMRGQVTVGIKHYKGNFDEKKGKNGFTIRVVKYGNKLIREVMELPYLETLKLSWTWNCPVKPSWP